MEQKLIESAIMWGPGMMLAVFVLYGFYRLANTIGLKIVVSSQEQSQAIVGLTTTIQSFVTRDNSEHREIIILIKVMMEKIERMEEAAWTREKNASKG